MSYNVPVVTNVDIIHLLYYHFLKMTVKTGIIQIKLYYIFCCIIQGLSFLSILFTYKISLVFKTKFMEKLFEKYYWLQIGYFVLLSMIVIILVYVFLDKYFCKLFEKKYVFIFENDKIIIFNGIKEIIIDLEEIIKIKITEKYSFLPMKSMILYYNIKIQTNKYMYKFNTQKQLNQKIIRNTKTLLRCIRKCRAEQACSAGSAGLSQPRLS